VGKLLARGLGVLLFGVGVERVGTGGESQMRSEGERGKWGKDISDCGDSPCRRLQPRLVCSFG
jgi:hypothetical protein